MGTAKPAIASSPRNGRTSSSAWQFSISAGLPALTVELRPASLRRGETLGLIVRTALGAGQDLRARLLATGRCTESGSECAETRHHQIYAQDFSLVESLPAATVAEAVFEGALLIPASAPPTFGASHNEVLWTVEVEQRSEGAQADAAAIIEVQVITVLP